MVHDVFRDKDLRPSTRKLSICGRCGRGFGAFEPMYLVDDGWSCEECLHQEEINEMQREHDELVGVES